MLVAVGDEVLSGHVKEGSQNDLKVDPNGVIPVGELSILIAADNHLYCHSQSACYAVSEADHCIMECSQTSSSDRDNTCHRTGEDGKG